MPNRRLAQLHRQARSFDTVRAACKAGIEAVHDEPV